MNDGIILVNKDKVMTSRNVDNAIGHLFHTKRVGHLGTLDPFATGLLVIGVNKGTKFLTYLDDSKKTYVAKLHLGKKTSTGDIDGEIFEEKDVPNFSQEEIEEVFTSFLGEGEQIPPMTSAIKIDGVPLYKKAHKGIEVERKPRKVFIYSLKFISLEKNILTFETEVSRGTYIRVLGEDIAKKLGNIGYLEELERTSLGNFSLKDAVKLDSLNENSLIDASPYLPFPVYQIQDEEEYKEVLNGVMLYVGKDLGESIVVKKGEMALAIYKKVEDTLVYKPERGLF